MINYDSMFILALHNLKLTITEQPCPPPRQVPPHRTPPNPTQLCYVAMRRGWIKAHTVLLSTQAPCTHLLFPFSLPPPPPESRMCYGRCLPLTLESSVYISFDQHLYSPIPTPWISMKSTPPPSNTPPSPSPSHIPWPPLQYLAPPPPLRHPDTP